MADTQGRLTLDTPEHARPGAWSWHPDTHAKKVRLIFRGSSAVCACLALAAGCVSDQAHRYYADMQYPPKPVEEVEVLREAPSREYEVIADFQARGATSKYMRKKAAEIGADAVIVGTYGGYRSKSDAWASQDKYSRTYSRITGTAIKYKR